MANFRFRNTEAFPPIIKNLIIINILVWIALLIFDKQDGVLSMWLTDKIALSPIGFPTFKPYQIITYMFGHASYSISGDIEFLHILFNMWVLFMFGRIMENVWGGKRFLLFYLACGVGAGLAHLAIEYFTNGNAGAIGASGAIMGVFVAFGYSYPNEQLMIIPIPVPIRAKWLVLAYIVIDLVGGFGKVAGDNVAHFAHLGGALTGFLIVFFWNKNNRRTLY